MSSCSFSDSDAQEPLKAQNIGGLRLENEQLRQSNEQMRETIASLQNQLRQALQATSAVESVKKQMTILQGKLRDANEQNEVLSQRLSTHRGDTNATVINQLRQTVSTLESQLEESETRCKKLKKEKVEMASALKKQQEMLDEATATAEHLKKKKKKVQKQQLKDQEYYEEMETKANKAEAEIRRVVGENKSLQQEVEDLKIQIQTATATNNDLVNANKALKTENQKLLAAFSALEDQVSEQSNEIITCHEERQVLTEMLRKMHSYVCASESLNGKLQTELNDLNLKLKIKPQVRDDSDQFDGAAIEIPFTGTLGSRCRQVLEMRQYKPCQRIQMIFNTVASDISDKESAIQARDEQIEKITSALEKEESGSQKLGGVLKALLKELKNLAVTEASIDKCANCDADRGFIQFVAEKCVLSTENGEKETIPMDFFSIDDVSTRKQILEKFVQPQSEVFSLFVAQFLANTILRKQLQKVVSVLPKKEELSAVLTELKCGSLDELVSYVTACQAELMKMKRLNLKLQKQFKKSKQDQPATSEMSIKAQLSRMQMQNDELQNELDIMHLRNQVLNNELTVTRQDDSKQKEVSVVDTRIPELEALLSQKDAEIEQLKKTLDGSKRKNMEVIQKLSSKQSKREKALLDEVETFKTRASELEIKVAKKVKRHKQTIKELVRQNEQQMTDISNEYEQSKAAYEATIKTMEDKMSTTREQSQKLLSAVSEKEKLNQKLAEENSQLRLTQKSLEIKILKLQETSQKERQVLLGQLSATKLSCQSHIQEADKLSKKQAETRVQELYNEVSTQLSEFYRLDRDSLDDETFKQLLILVKRDLNRLQIFQTQGLCVP